MRLFEITSFGNTLLPVIAVELFICGWIGYAAVALYRKRQALDWISPDRSDLLHLVFAPVAGLLTIYWLSILAIPFPQGKAPLLVGLLIFATWINASDLKNNRVTVMSVAVVLLFLLSLIFLVRLNSQDLLRISAANYFPRTNGDTFSYLSQMDQFRVQPLTLDRQVYPAGFSGFYSQPERNAVAGLSSFFANGLALDSHVAFFSTLRLILVCMLLGVLSILLVINLQGWIIASSFLIYAFGCFYLNTVLQQYLSSTTGVLASIGVIFFCCLWAQSGYRRCDALLLGACLGLLLVYSPETFPPLFLALSFFILITLVDRRAREKLGSFPRAILALGGGALITSLPLLFDPAFIFWRLATTLQHYVDVPYDLQTFHIFGLYLTGLRGSTLWLGITGIERFVMYSLCLVVVIGPMFLFARSMKQAVGSTAPWDGRRSAITFLSVLGVTWIFVQLIFMTGNMTYVWVKTMDYYNFLPCLMLALVGGWLAGESSGKRKWLAVAGLVAFSAVYISAAIPGKRERLAFYRSNLMEGPPLDAYAYPEPEDGAVAGIIPAVEHPFALDLFYYVNRWRSIPLKVYNATEERKWGSWRFRQDSGRAPQFKFTHRFCLPQQWGAFSAQKDCDESRVSALVPVPSSAQE